jgi:hypothetical protein
MDGTAADREGGQRKDAARETQAKREAREALAHRGGPLLEVAEAAAKDENVVVIDSTEEAA